MPSTRGMWRVTRVYGAQRVGHLTVWWALQQDRPEQKLITIPEPGAPRLAAGLCSAALTSGGPGSPCSRSTHESGVPASTAKAGWHPTS